MFANPDIAAGAGNFEGWHFTSMFSFGNDNGWEFKEINDITTDKKLLLKPNQVQNVMCSMKYHHKEE